MYPSFNVLVGARNYEEEATRGAGVIGYLLVPDRTTKVKTLRLCV